MSQEQNQGQGDQGKESKKVLANFETTVKKLTAVVKGPDNLKIPTKVKADSMEGLISELFKEENEATIKQVKEELKSLLKGYVQLNQSLNEERKKLDNLEISKKKEFNATAAKLFNKIEGIDGITKDYYGALVDAGKAVEEAKEEDDNTEE